jgi:hypothetical protein
VTAIRHREYNRLTWAALGWFVLGWVQHGGGSAAGQEHTAWKTGAALARQLEQPAGIRWQQQALRHGLNRLSSAYGVAIFLDRRIDPDQLVSITIQDVPLETLLSQVAAKSQGDSARQGSVIYVGPPETAAELATLAALRRQEIAKLSSEARARLLKAKTWRWEELTQPRQLVVELAREAGVTVTNLDAVPHDLWPAVELPLLAWVDRLTLVLAGFGLTFELDAAGNVLRLVAMPRGAVLEKRYMPGGSANALAAQLRRVLPEANIRVEQGQIILSGRQEDHEKVERLLAGQSVRTSKPGKAQGEKLYTMQVASEPAGNVVRSVAKSLNKELKYDSLLLERLKKPVTFDVKDVTLEFLLQATLEPQGLTYQITERDLIVTAAR